MKENIIKNPLNPLHFLPGGTTLSTVLMVRVDTNKAIGTALTGGSEEPTNGDCDDAVGRRVDMA